MDDTLMEFITTFIFEFGGKTVNSGEWAESSSYKLYSTNVNLDYYIFAPYPSGRYFPLQIRPELIEQYKKQVNDA